MADQEKTKLEMLFRMRIIYILFFINGVAILAWILWLQFGVDSAMLRDKAQKSVFERVTIPANRGDVLSLDGRLLATSIPTYKIRMDFAATGLADSTFEKNVGPLSDSLSRFFGDRSAGSYKKMLQGMRAHRNKNRYAVISNKRINHIELARVSKFPLFKLGQNKGGFIVEQINKRIFPHGQMAKRTIGNVNLEGRGTGIEGAFDDDLRGKDGNALMQKISGNFRIPVNNELNVEPQNGCDVVTTIDVEIQDVADASLRRQMEEAGSDWGTAILMEVATGEIRAISNLSRRNGELVEDYNHAIGTSLEPGSTLKLASLIILLDDAGMSLDDIIDTGNGTEYMYGFKVVDTKREGHGKIPLKEVFEVSSNIGFGRAVNDNYRKNQQRFVDKLRDLGMGDSLPIQLRGYAKPVIYDTKDRSWSASALTAMSYGYGMRMTPIQILTLYNAVANRGKMISPLFVKELRQYGEVIASYQTQVIRDKICSDSTLAKARECLEGVVRDGTARRLKTPLYTVAGKTGTAQIALGRHGYYDRSRGGRHYLGTIVGYFPADNPKYTCIVAIKTFRKDGGTNPYYGGSLAGPVFRDIADRVYCSNVAWQPKIAEVKKPTQQLPAVKAGKKIEPEKMLRNVKMKASQINDNGAEYSSYAVFGDTININQRQIASGVMPDVHGMGLRDALVVLESLGLRVKSSGVGKVVTQSPESGAIISRGGSAHITLEL